MSRRHRIPRRRGRRPSLAGALLRAVAIGGLVYVVLAEAADMTGGAAVLLGAFAAGFAVRGRIRVPYVRTGWRRLR
jgi:hypothetical protein